MLIYPLEVYTWVSLKGILQCLSSPQSPSLRTTENLAEGPRCHFVLLKLVSRVDIWTNWAPQILFPENLELEVEDVHQPLRDSRSKACELGKEVVAAINSSTQRPRESQVLTGEWNRRWSSRAERQGQLPQLLLTARPQPLCQAPSHTSDASPSNPRFHQLISCGFWWLATKRSLRQLCQLTLTAWQASKTTSL